MYYRAVCVFCCTDIASLCSERTILSSNSLNLPLDDVFQTVPSPDRSVGVRFLYPVYLIDRVEMTPHHTTADNTTDKGYCHMYSQVWQIHPRSDVSFVLNSL